MLKTCFIDMPYVLFCDNLLHEQVYFKNKRIWTDTDVWGSVMVIFHLWFGFKKCKLHSTYTHTHMHTHQVLFPNLFNQTDWKHVSSNQNWGQSTLSQQKTISTWCYMYYQRSPVIHLSQSVHKFRNKKKITQKTPLKMFYNQWSISTWNSD